jgi:tRNA pseudouridine55 synthase
MKPGIYLVHKPAGPTSNELVRAFVEEIRLAGIRPDKLPVSHGGALDPFAEGLLPLLVGQAARLMELLHPLPKTYLAEVTWGTETDNGDLLGKPVAQGDASSLTPAALDAALQEFIGFRDQIPPATSNKRIGGERAYEKAHRGEVFELPPSKVYLHEARFTSHDLPRTSTLQLTCRGGYYVRSLARDLGRATKARAHLSKLQRTSIGPWQDPQARVFLGGEQLFPWCESRTLDDRELARLQKGTGIDRGHLRPAQWHPPDGFPALNAPIRAIHQGKLLAMLKETDGQLTASPLLRSPL